MSFSDFNFTVYHFNYTESTNIHALEAIHAKKAKNGDIFWTDYQTKGKGQRGGFWKANKGENLLFSLVLEPNLSVEKQFYLSMIAALSVHDLLLHIGIEKVKVKWPNDVLVDGKKIAGILIENSLQGSKINYSIIGIGLNVNQVDFKEVDRKATSIALELHSEHRVKTIFGLWQDAFRPYYDWYLSNAWEKIKDYYLKSLFAYQTPYRFKDDSGEFIASIIGIEESGKLLLRKNSEIRSYNLKEVKFIAEV